MKIKKKFWYLTTAVVTIITILFIHRSMKTQVYKKYSPYQKNELLWKRREKLTTPLIHKEKPLPNTTPSDNKLFNVDFNFGRWDNRRLYKFFDNVLIGDKYTEISTKYNICLATQSSLERLDSLVQVSNHWSGSISLSIFIAGDEYALLEFYISYLRECFPQIRDHVTFHLAFSPSHPPSEDHFNFIINQDCNNPDAVLQEVLQYRTQETTNWRTNSVYPQNHLRNQARKNCQCSYVFLTDIDIIPKPGMAEGVDAFLKSNSCNKLCAYIIPVYEIDDTVDFPKNKSDMVQLVNARLARPFHLRVYKAAQSPTDYKTWENVIEEDESVVHVSHIANYKNWYEPFFVVDDTAPPHDERFIGYGFSRNTQVFEMNEAGYEFFVLSPVFACHWHLQTLEEDYYPWRRKQLRTNSKLVSDFKIEVSARYKNIKKPKPKTSEIKT